MEENNEMNEPEHKPFTDKELVRVVAIVFVLAIYLIIFLKILILQ